MEAVKGAREAEDLSDAMVGMLSRLAAAQQVTTNSLQAAQDFAAQCGARVADPADGDARRPRHPANPRPPRRGTRRGGRRPRACPAAGGGRSSPRSANLPPASWRSTRTAKPSTSRICSTGWRERTCGSAPPRSSSTPSTSGTIECWPGGLRLAVDNLVRNAITHGEAGRIVLTARPGPGDVLTIVVDDNGRGLPAEEHENVMGRFARGTTAAPGGSGLGLALVAQQAALHGGHIESVRQSTWRLAGDAGAGHVT